jgi:hypothetical protein
MTKAVWGRSARGTVAAVIAVVSVSCGDLTRQGQGSSYLIVRQIEAAQGHAPDEFFGTLSSDVETIIDGVKGIFPDLGRVTLQLALKDPGPGASPNSPSVANQITVERYHVEFIRADGRNTQGVDVPYAFDGAFTATVPAEGTVTASFVLVRLQAKNEAPLRALVSVLNPVIISTIARVTFYGRDQTGREVSVTGQIDVSFGNFADPTS